MRTAAAVCVALLAVAGCSPTDSGASGNTGGPVTRALTVNDTGPGAVSGAGFSGCRSRCVAQVADGAAITLTAAPDSGAVFAGWSQGCSGTGACSFTASADTEVTATFAMPAPPPPGQHNLIVSKNGAGRVQSTPAGIDCGATCAAAFASGSSIALSAAPDAGFQFAGWGGACSGAGPCTVSLTAADATVFVTFTATAPPPPGMQTLTVARSGNGRVTSTPAGIDCGATCSAQFTFGAQVTLSAAPDADWSFSGWSGACTGAGSCAVAMNSAQSVTATFEALPPPPPDECAGLAPTAPGTKVRVQVPSGPGQVCDAGHADGQGNLALGYHGGGATLHFFDPAGAPTGNFMSTGGQLLQLDDQAGGFIAIDGQSRHMNALVDWVKPSGQLAGQSTAGGDGFVSLDDPTGGVVLVTFPFPAAYPNALEAYDAHGAPRWKIPRSDGEIYIAHGVDRVGNTLLLTRIGTTDNVHGKWFDHEGNEQGGYVPVGNFGRALQLVPRIGSGLFLQTLTNSWYAAITSPIAFVAQIDTLAPAFTDPPAWLHAYDARYVHPARGGTAYAFIDPPAQTADCNQRVDVVATTGKSCGSAVFNAGVNGACQTASLRVGWDGTVVQQLAPVLEGHDPAGAQTSCTWQWWPAFLR